MNLGTVLVLIGIVLAVLAWLIEPRRHMLIIAAIVAIGIGVLVGVETIDLDDDAEAAVAVGSAVG